FLPHCSALLSQDHPPAATSRRSLQACIASLPLQSSLMSKTYLKSDHFNGGGSLPQSIFSRSPADIGGACCSSLNSFGGLSRSLSASKASLFGGRNFFNHLTSSGGGSSIPFGTSCSGGRLKPSNGRYIGRLANPLSTSLGVSASKRLCGVQAPTNVTAGWLIVILSS